MDPCFVYEDDNNPEQTYLPGVPRRDLLPEDVAALTPYQLASVQASAFYRPGTGALPEGAQTNIEDWRTATTPQSLAAGPGPSEVPAITPPAVVAARLKKPGPNETKLDLPSSPPPASND